MNSFLGEAELFLKDYWQNNFSNSFMRGRERGKWERAVKSYFFQLHLSPFLCESIKKGASPHMLF
jgi:hypothetical protein